MIVNPMPRKFFKPLNVPRHSLTTRWLYTVIPSEMYAKNTLDVLLQALADDLEMLFNEGLQATCLPL